MATQEQVQELFRLLDIDQDGKVSIEELYGSSLYPLLINVIESIHPAQFLRNYDSDNDGSLTLEEFKKAVEAGATK